MTSVPAFGIPQKLNRMQQISSQANDTKTDIALLFRNLGVTLKKSMSWADHVSTKINQRIVLIRRLRKLLPLQAKVTFVKYPNPPSFWLRRQHYGEHNRITCLSQRGDYFFYKRKLLGPFEVSPSRKPVGELAIKNIRS